MFYNYGGGQKYKNPMDSCGPRIYNKEKMKRFLVIFVLCLMPCALHAEYMCKQCYTSCTSAYQLNPDGNGSGCGTCEEAKCSGGQYWNGTECKACKIGYYCPVGSVSLDASKAREPARVQRTARSMRERKRIAIIGVRRGHTAMPVQALRPAAI